MQLIFINLPVKDVAASIAFYEAIGATKDERFCDGTTGCMNFSDTIKVMLLSHERFADFTSKTIIDPKTQVQALLCISRDSREAVDAIVDAAVAAGGVGDPSPIDEYGFMYGRSFEDLDGNGWGPMYMDIAAFDEAMAKAKQPEPA